MHRERPVILIIDDDPPILEWLSASLASQADVLVCGTGEQGLAMALQNRPSLILCDLVMPELGGISVCERLQDDPVTRCIPILCISALDDPEDEVAAFSAGAADFIKKPLIAEVVQARVRHLLRCQHEAAALRQMVNIDALTGIANRRCFNERYAQEWRRQRRNRGWLTVAIVDIDRFKDYNDCFGHVKGDACLAAVARCLAELVRRPADMVARYGGEEFVFILPHLTPQHAAAFAQSICEAVRALRYPAAVGGCNVTVSVGVASVIPSDLEEGGDLLANADLALYQAKGAGRDCYAVHRAPSGLVAATSAG